MKAAVQDTKSYDILLGLDVLMPLRAVVDLDKMMMTLTHKGEKSCEVLYQETEETMVMSGASE